MKRMILKIWTRLVAFTGALPVLGCVLVVIGAFSCSVHQWPDESTPAVLKLDFVFSTDLPPYLTVNYETKTDISSESTTKADKEHAFRYTVKFYPRLPDGSFSRNEAPDYTLVLTKDDLSTLDYSTLAVLPEGDWQIRCWADYVAKGSTDDLYYETGDFAAIALPELHSANTDYKDAFLGSAEVSLQRVGSKQEPIAVTLDMERPLAKFRFIATDLERLMMKVLKEKLSSEEYSRWINARKLEKEAMNKVKEGETKVTVETPAELLPGSDVSNAWNPAKAPGFNPSDYYIRFYYTSFMPFMFDMFKNKPIDSRAGVQFDSEFSPISMDEVLMGFDYVMVNGHESSVIVQVALYDKKTNNLLSLTPSITVPIVRSRITTVRGDFLTLSTGGSIGVNAEFNGEYNINL